MRLKRNWLSLFKIRGFWINPFWVKSFLLGLMAVSLIWVVASHTRLHINRTDSAPHLAFICTDFLSVSLGDYASIEGYQAEYFSGLHYTKKVAGLPGDTIEIKDEQLYVGSRLIGPLLTQTTQGLKLTPAAPRRVPTGSVFVVGDHSRSFDSRYKEFGLVQVAHIKGRCFGIGKRKADQV